jgi:hypothetical protein
LVRLQNLKPVLDDTYNFLSQGSQWKSPQEFQGIDPAVRQQAGPEASRPSAEASGNRPEASSSRAQRDVPVDTSQLVLKWQWDAQLQGARAQNTLTLSQQGVELLKNVPMESWDTRNIRFVTLNGYDLRGIHDLGERLGAFKDLQTLDLRNCRIDAMDVSALPKSLNIDLRGSVVPLPLQQRLQEQEFGHTVALTPRTGRGTRQDGQIERYQKGTLQEWVGKRKGDEKRKQAAKDIIEHLQRPTASLAITDKKIRALDDDFPAMIASNELTELDLSGNELGIGRQSVARLSLSPNLELVDLCWRLCEAARIRRQGFCKQYRYLTRARLL